MIALQRVDAWDGAGLGDVFCFNGDCILGVTLINEMRTVFLSQISQGSQAFVNKIIFEGKLDFGMAHDNDLPWLTKFGPAVNAIIFEQIRLSRGLSSFSPFWLTVSLMNSDICCSLKELGRKAQELTQAMHEASGTFAPPRTHVEDPFDPASGFFGRLLGDVKTLITVVVIGAGIVFIAPPIIRELKSSSSTSSPSSGGGSRSHAMGKSPYARRRQMSGARMRRRHA